MKAEAMAGNDEAMRKLFAASAPQPFPACDVPDPDAAVIAAMDRLAAAMDENSAILAANVRALEENSAAIRRAWDRAAEGEDWKVGTDPEEDD